MTAAGDEFEALFDEISAQRDKEIAATSAPEAGPAAEPSAAASESAAPETAAAAEACPAPGAGADDQSGMFERLGAIVRMLHDSLRELGYDRSLSNVASQINDAQDRLAYIANLTEQAATKVLNAIDLGMPAQDILAAQSKTMEDRWAQLFAGKLSVEEFKQLAGDSKQFAADVATRTEEEKARLLEIMMAQDFQDITGQLIKKIVAITNTVERELAQLLRDNAPPELRAAIEASEQQAQAAAAAAAASTGTPIAHGPSMPAEAMAQDGVDDLLASLGF